MRSEKTTRMNAGGLWVALMMLALTGLTACKTVGPDFQPVTPLDPVTWHAQLPAGITVESSDSQTLA